MFDLRVPVFSAFDGRYLGNLTVWFDKYGEIVSWSGNPIFLDHSIEESEFSQFSKNPDYSIIMEAFTTRNTCTPDAILELISDAEILKALEPWKKEVDKVALKKVGSTRVQLNNQCRNKECNMGNFITNAMVDAVRMCFAILCKET